MELLLVFLLLLEKFTPYIRIKQIYLYITEDQGKENNINLIQNQKLYSVYIRNYNQYDYIFRNILNHVFQLYIDKKI